MPLKIAPAHYAHLKTAMAAHAGDIPAMRAAIVAEGKAKDIEMRLRWDLWRKAGLLGFTCDVLYKPEGGNLTDEHIDNALKAIMREIERPAPAAEAEEPLPSP